MLNIYPIYFTGNSVILLYNMECDFNVQKIKNYLPK